VSKPHDQWSKWRKNLRDGRLHKIGKNECPRCNIMLQRLLRYVYAQKTPQGVQVNPPKFPPKWMYGSSRWKCPQKSWTKPFKWEAPQNQLHKSSMKYSRWNNPHQMCNENPLGPFKCGCMVLQVDKGSTSHEITLQEWTASQNHLLYATCEVNKVQSSFPKYNNHFLKLCGSQGYPHVLNKTPHAISKVDVPPSYMIYASK